MTVARTFFIGCHIWVKRGLTDLHLVLLRGQTCTQCCCAVRPALSAGARSDLHLVLLRGQTCT